MENNLDWFRVDNLEPQLRYGYPSSTGARILHVDPDGPTYHQIDGRNADIPNDMLERFIEVFDELRQNLGRHHDDNKIVIGYKRKDNGEMVYVGWYDGMRNIGMHAKNRDGAEPTRPWNTPDLDTLWYNYP